MIDIYQTWVDVRHRRLPHRHRQARQHRVLAAVRARADRFAAPSGNDDFFMFGEVFDADPRVHVALHDRGRAAGDARLRVPGQRRRLRQRRPDDGAARLLRRDDYYTDTDSNAYSLPTFLGNHDMGRIGSFISASGGRRDDDELLARDQLGHSLMYLTRGQPVVYYGDEQGFVGEQAATRTPARGHVPVAGRRVQRRRPDRHRRHHRGRQLRPGPPAVPAPRRLSELRDEHPALADGAQIHRYASNAARHLRGSAGSTPTTRSSTSSPRTTPRRPKTVVRRRSATACSSGRVAGGHRQSQDRPGGRVTSRCRRCRPSCGRPPRRAQRTAETPAPFFRTPAAAARSRAGPRSASRCPGRLQPGDLRLAGRSGTEDWTSSAPTTTRRTASSTTCPASPPGTPVEYRASRSTTTATSASRRTRPPAIPAPPGGGGGGGGPVEQPAEVSVPGSHNSRDGLLRRMAAGLGRPGATRRR